jgi:exopolysaccharide production protein ExoZ
MQSVSSAAAGENLSGIQILRAIAAFMVVLHHSEWVVKSNFATTSWPTFGAAGVDLFFVISGFIICLTTSRATDPAQFIRKRLIRIIPLYWLVTLITFAIMCVDERFLDWQQANPVNLIKSLLFIPYGGGGGLIQPILFVGWSLNYEILFYALWAVTLFLFPTSIGRRILLVAGALTAMVLVGIVVGPEKAVVRFSTNPIMLEFAAGAAIGWAYIYRRIFFARVPLALCMIATGLALVAFVLLHNPHTPHVTQAGLAVAIITTVLALEARDLPLRSTILETLGNASYAIYLTHPLIIAFAVRAPIFDLMEPGIARFLTITFALLATVVGIGLASYFGFERPINRRLRQSSRSSPQPIAQDGASTSSASKVS